MKSNIFAVDRYFTNEENERLGYQNAITFINNALYLTRIRTNRDAYGCICDMLVKTRRDFVMINHQLSSHNHYYRDTQTVQTLLTSQQCCVTMIAVLELLASRLKEELERQKNSSLSASAAVFVPKSIGLTQDGVRMHQSVIVDKSSSSANFASVREKIEKSREQQGLTDSVLVQDNKDNKKGSTFVFGSKEDIEVNQKKNIDKLAVVTYQAKEPDKSQSIQRFQFKPKRKYNPKGINIERVSENEYRYIDNRPIEELSYVIPPSKGFKLSTNTPAGKALVRINELKEDFKLPPVTEDDIHDNAKLHEIIQRDLRCIYESDNLLKYFFSRNSRKRVDMVFCFNEEVTACAASKLFVFQLNSEILQGKYRQAIHVCHTGDDRETEIEVLCMMMFRIMSDLKWGDGERSIVIRPTPIDLKFSELVTLTLIRQNLKENDRALRGLKTVDPWKAALIIDANTSMSDFPVEGRKFRLLLTNSTANSPGAHVTIVHSGDEPDRNEDISFGEKRDLVFAWLYHDVEEKQNVYFSITLKDKWGLRVAIDYQ